MEACIARGGISHVLSQARASLKNPSRPYTPRTSARSLFHGDDYRPGSRPSSSYTVMEKKELERKQSYRSDAKQTSSPSAPPVSMLPPRPTFQKKKTASPSSSASTPEDSDPLSASSNHLKLVHAPIIPAEEPKVGDHDICRHQVDSDDDFGPRDDDDHLEASLELPSQDQLYQTYSAAERCLQELASLPDQAQLPEMIERLRFVVGTFLHLSSFFLSSDQGRRPSSADTSKVQELRLHLFHAIAHLVLNGWSHSTECVLALTPSLLDLYCADTAARESGNSNSQVVLLGKLLFMLSKESTNDALFCNVHYVEAALSAVAKICGSRTDPKAKKHRTTRGDQEAEFLPIERVVLPFPIKVLIYLAGTLKNTSNAEEKMLKLLATNGAIAILSDTMLWRSRDPTQAKEIAQFLVQTTGILRNLSVAKSYHKQFIEAQVPSRLCAMIPAFIGHLELMGNVSRILSKLTLHELPRAQINHQMADNLQNLVAVVDCDQNRSLSLLEQQRPENRFQDLLLIRMYFVLGNLCAGNDCNRQFVAFDCRGVAVLLQALHFYASQYTQQQHDGKTREKEEHDEHGIGHSAGGSEQAGEVLVKLVRLLANLAINADIGAKLNGDEQMGVLLETLDQAQRRGDEELMLNIVSCITNLSYYSTAPPPSDRVSSSSQMHEARYSFIEGNRIVITSLLAQILLDRNEEAVVEATRAFGNLTRFKDVLAYMSDHKVLDCFVVLLDHSNREVVYTVCGVLMNAALDESTRRKLLQVRPEAGDNERRGDVRSLLLGIVECAATDDVEMTCMACKVLYNLLLTKESRSAPCSSEDDAAGFQSDDLRRVVQQILTAMDQQDSRHSHRQVNESGRRSSSQDGEHKDAGDDEEEDETLGDWRELRLVLPQLLRSTDS